MDIVIKHNIKFVCFFHQLTLIPRHLSALTGSDSPHTNTVDFLLPFFLLIPIIVLMYMFVLFNDRAMRTKCLFWSHTPLTQESFSQRGMMGIALCGTWPEESKSAPISTWWDSWPASVSLSLCLSLTVFGHIHTEAEYHVFLCSESEKKKDELFVKTIPLVFASFPQHMLSLSFLSISLLYILSLSLFFPSIITFTFAFCFLSPLCRSFPCHLMRLCVVAVGMSRGRSEIMTPRRCAYATVHIHPVC